MSEKLYDFIRTILTFLGGIFITKGYIDEETLMEVVGAVMTLLGVVWIYIKKNKDEKEEGGKGEV